MEIGEAGNGQWEKGLQVIHVLHVDQNHRSMFQKQELVIIKKGPL